MAVQLSLSLSLTHTLSLSPSVFSCAAAHTHTRAHLQDLLHVHMNHYGTVGGEKNPSVHYTTVLLMPLLVSNTYATSEPSAICGEKGANHNIFCLRLRFHAFWCENFERKVHSEILQHQTPAWARGGNSCLVPCQSSCSLWAQAPYVANHKRATKSSDGEVPPAWLALLLSLCPAHGCWVITKLRIFFCRSAIRSSSACVHGTGIGGRMSADMESWHKSSKKDHYCRQNWV